MVESSVGVTLSGAEPQPSRVIRDIALHALAAALMCVSPLVVLAPAAWMSCGLKHGMRAAFVCAVGSLLVLTGLAAADSTPRVFTGHLVEIVGLTLAVVLPVLSATSMMRSAQPFGRVMFGALMGSVAGLFGTEAVIRSLFGFSPYAALIRSFQAQSLATLDFYRKFGTTEPVLTEMKRFSETVASSYAVVMLVCLVATSLSLSMLMIARLPAGRSTGSTYLWRNLAFPDALLFGFVAGGLSPFATGALRLAGLNLLAIVVFLYFLQGLAVLRSLLVRIGFGLPGTLAAGLGIGLLLPFSAGLLFLAGLFDPFFDFRKMKRKDDSDESDTD